MPTYLPAHSVIAADGAEPSRTAVLLHGILGSKQNWRSFLRGAVAQMPDWRFITPDHRHHGESHGAPAPHTIDACADDLARLLDVLSCAPDAVLGHSFGAKVAMTYAERNSAGLRQLWVLDAVPGDVTMTDDALARHEVVRVIGTLKEIALPLSSRAGLVQILTRRGFSEPLARWMTTNLRHDRSAGGFVWRFDLPGVEALLHSYLGTNVWPFVEDLPLDLTMHVVIGGRSAIWTDLILDRLAGADGAIRLHTLPGAGHWVHADAPAPLTQLFVEHLAGA